MSGKRQKNQNDLASPAESRGEAPMAVRGGSETRTAERRSESLVSTDRLMEEVCERNNLLEALKRKQWKRGRTRFAELRRRGVGKDLAACTAGSPHGPWRLSRSPALSYALPNAFFEDLGLATLLPKAST